MFYGLALMPMGAVIFADRYLMRSLGMVEFYAERAGMRFHWPPLVAWICSILLCAGLWCFAGIHEVFLCLPGWIASAAVYLALSKVMQRPLPVTGEYS
jgi:purine-cytosine permease-like protein